MDGLVTARITTLSLIRSVFLPRELKLKLHFFTCTRAYSLKGQFCCRLVEFRKRKLMTIHSSLNFGSTQTKSFLYEIFHF